MASGKPVLRVGVAVGDVTPPVGIDVTGFCLRLTTHAIHRTLRVSAVAFSDGIRTMCLVAADLVGLPVAYATELRRDIATQLATTPDSVLVTCSHTHNAPSLQPGQKIGGRQDEWTAADRDYEARWRSTVLSLCRQAHDSMKPARLAASRDGTAAIGINRRLRLSDGRMIIGRVEGRPADHSVGVVRIDRTDGSPLVTLFNYACHAISLGPEAEIISPDYPGAARETLESITGAPAVFIQGAGGDVAPRDGMGDDPSIADALGTTLGLEAAKVWSTIETRNLERREVIVQSYNAIASLRKIEHPALPAFVAALAETIDLPLLPPPTEGEVVEIARLASQRLQELVDEGAGEGQLNIQRAEVRWAGLLERSMASGGLDRTATGVVQALMVDGVTFVALPVEPFVLIGRALIDALGPRTIVCGYANGTIGYCPMPSDYEEGGYEIERAHRLYGYPAALAPEVSGILIQRSIDLARQLRTHWEVATR